MASVETVPSQGNGITSPAKQQKTEHFDYSLDPSTVTAEYLKALQAAITEPGQLKTATELLTSKARTATQLANVDVALPGTQNAEYLVHQASYVTNEKTTAHVPTTWKDRIENRDYEYDVTWILKKEPGIGWRVSGMITTAEPNAPPIVFNFEDAADIVSKGGPGQPETQTAGKEPKTDVR